MKKTKQNKTKPFWSSAIMLQQQGSKRMMQVVLKNLKCDRPL